MLKNNNEQKPNYKVVMVETDLPHSYSGSIDVNMEADNTFSFNVYNNPDLYRLLTRAIEKHFS